MSDRRARDVVRVGCVSYLNAKPLIHPVEEAGRGSIQVKFDVPAALLDALESGETDIALCPVVDLLRSDQPLEIVPVGGIGCRGATWTVRLFSRVPVERVTRVHVDVESHTSVALLRVLMAGVYGVAVEVVPWQSRAVTRRFAPKASLSVGVDQREEGGGWPEAVLLIGDKVVTGSPSAVVYPHGLDLGEAWFEWTGLPFVFATWLCRVGAELGDVPALLENQREVNLARVPELVELYAAKHGWPADMASEYLGQVLRYRVGEEELAGVRRFAELAEEYGVIEAGAGVRVRVRGEGDSPGEQAPRASVNRR